jgi:hypothetical protein
MMRGTAVLLALLLGACTAEQVGRSAQSACRANPTSCSDAGAIPATRPLGP